MARSLDKSFSSPLLASIGSDDHAIQVELDRKQKVRDEKQRDDAWDNLRGLLQTNRFLEPIHPAVGGDVSNEARAGIKLPDHTLSEVASDAAKMTRRGRFGEFMESSRVHWFIVSMVFLDVIIVTTELLFVTNGGYCRGDLSETPRTEHALHYVSISICIIFLIEILLMFIAFGFTYFKHRGYVIDFIVVVSSFLLQWFFTDLAAYLMIFRLWRVLKIAHEVVETRVDKESQARDSIIREAAECVIQDHKRDLEKIERLERVLYRYKKASDDSEDLRRKGKELDALQARGDQEKLQLKQEIKELKKKLNEMRLQLVSMNDVEVGLKTV